jgi:hypothetical protein
VVRFRPGEADDIGHLIRKRGGIWAFHYDIDSDEEDDEAGYRFGDHAFKLGEYVSIREDEDLRTWCGCTFRVEGEKCGWSIFRFASVNLLARCSSSRLPHKA